MSESLNKILYDPFSYLHSQRLKLNNHLILTAICRSAVNDLIFDVYHLTSPDVKINTQLKFWLRYWDYLPQIVYLVGCHVNREKLMWRGRILSIPEWARDYLKMAQPYTSELISSTLEKPTNSVILKAGYSGLIEYIEELPIPLKQRFPLLFPDWIDNVDSQFTINPFILRIISQYVEKNKPIMPADIC
ncbi:TPA: type III secretion apparatus protein OrgA/MxiK [Yersinia enterocolitica]|nr:type III secretion apparatus protein OrgA/MxiK [Yersinia enterocolitica]